jgi:polyphenol oxidase
MSEVSALERVLPRWGAPNTVKTWVSTRHGGVSDAPWASLNLGVHVGDDALLVAENRRRLTAQLPSMPVWLNQVHGIACIEAGSGYRSGSGVVDADASFSRTPGVVCAVMTADCLPVLFCDIAGTVVAAAHAGWRGLAAGVLESTLASMAVEPATVMAWIGPAIGPTAFEVGAEVREVFVAHDAQASAAFSLASSDPAGKFWCDLPLLAEQRLRRAGVAEVTASGECTYTDSTRFFSYRRDGQTGRQVSCIWLAS